MRVLQSSYKDKSGKTCKALTWYVEFTDHERTLIQRRIDATDKEIDKLVYELYDLTDEEIAIVEGGIEE